MGTGMAQVAVLLLLTVLALPLAFFALMAALDRFERRLDPFDPRVGEAAPAVETAGATVLVPAAASRAPTHPLAPAASLSAENAAADVVPLPVTTPATAPTAAAI